MQHCGASMSVAKVRVWVAQSTLCAFWPVRVNSRQCVCCILMIAICYQLCSCQIMGVQCTLACRSV